MYYVYVLQSTETQEFYTGYSANLKKRVEQHNTGKSFYTSMHGPYKLIYYEASMNRHDAIAREKYLKSGMGKRYLKNRMKNYLKLGEEASNGIKA